MGIFGDSDQNERKFELVPEGKYLGVLRFAVDCGHHHDSYKGVATIKHLIFMGWELDCKDSNGNPHWKGDFYTATDFIHGATLKNGKPNPKAGQEDWLWGTTSNFNKILRGWTGQDAETVKWKQFTADLIRNHYPCYITIEHTQDKNDATKFYSNIDSIKPVKDGKTYHRLGEVVSWAFGDDGFDDLPGNIRKKINASIEKTEGGYKVPPKSDKPKEQAKGVAYSDDDSIPF